MAAPRCKGVWEVEGAPGRCVSSASCTPHGGRGVRSPVPRHPSTEPLGAHGGLSPGHSPPPHSQLSRSPGTWTCPPCRPPQLSGQRLQDIWSPSLPVGTELATDGVSPVLGHPWNDKGTSVLPLSRVWPEWTKRETRPPTRGRAHGAGRPELSLTLALRGPHRPPATRCAFQGTAGARPCARTSRPRGHGGLRTRGLGVLPAGGSNRRQ